jgi:Fe2+ or Zn2+ uptake regulation protein
LSRCFYAATGHVDLDDLYLKVMKQDRRIGQSTVYRTMKLLVQSGLAHAHHFSDAPTRYEVAVEGQHHDHLICTVCGKILEFENPTIEKLQDEVADSFGFKNPHAPHGALRRVPGVPGEGQGLLRAGRTTGIGLGPGLCGPHKLAFPLAPLTAVRVARLRVRNAALERQAVG